MRKIFNFIIALLSFILSINFTLFASEIDDKKIEQYKNISDNFALAISLLDKMYINDIDENKILEKSLKGLISSLCDEYTEYFTQEEYDEYLKGLNNGNYDLGYTHYVDECGNYIVDEVLDQTYAKQSGMKKGDKILFINNVSLQDNNINNVLRDFFVKKTNNLEFRVLRNNIELQLNFNIDIDDFKSVVYKDISEILKDNFIDDLDDIYIDKSVGYIKISTIIEGTYNQFEEALNTAITNNKSKIILDLRGNLGGILTEAVKICEKIVPEGDIISFKYKNGHIETYRSELKELPFEKIVVLTDLFTASSAEIITSAIKDSNAGVIVGTKTYGKGTSQHLFPFLGGALKITTAEAISRNGNKINKIGVTPDILVEQFFNLSEDDVIGSKKLQKALFFIGYEVDNEYKIKKALDDIKLDKLLSLNSSYRDIIELINIKLYKVNLYKDYYLLNGYYELMKP